MELGNFMDVNTFLEKESCLLDYSQQNTILNVGLDDFEKIKTKMKKDLGDDFVVIGFKEGIEVYMSVKDLSYCNKYVIEASNYMERKNYTFTDLIDLMRVLRSENGCPWDRVQTHESIKSNAIEESYELVEAIELADNEMIKEESGDVLLQAIFHAEIANDANNFSLSDVVSALCNKIITRHTHVFGSEHATNEEEALIHWQQAKYIEKSQQTVGDKLDSVAKTFGSVMRANKVQKIAKKFGFDFNEPDQAKAKIFEELDELRDSRSKENLEWEAGDLLFATINYVRMLDIDPEIALNKCTSRFVSRFKHVEKMALKNNVELKIENIDILEEYYQDSKKFENQNP